MEQWKEQAVALLRTLFASPASDREFALLIVAATVFLLIGLRVLAGAWGMKMTGWSRIIIAALLGIALTLAAVTAVRVYALPEISGNALRTGLQIGAALVALLLIVVPLLCWLLHGRYFESMMTVACSLLAAALLTALVDGIFKSVQHGAGVANAQREKRAAEEREMAE